MRLLIAGVGRSGTSTLFHALGRAALRTDPDCECWYEPDLWRIGEALKTASIAGAAFDNEQIDAFSIHVHKATPLFADRSTPLYDAWLDEVFGVSEIGQPAPPRVVKTIRSMGRLRPTLERVPDLRVLVTVRNPLEAVNSSIGRFSYFGEEFHASDRPRFATELDEAGLGPDSWPEQEDTIGWASLWVEAFRTAAFRAADMFGDRVHILSHEVYLADRAAALAKIHDWASLGPLGPDAASLATPTGPTTGRRNITDPDAERLVIAVENYAASLAERGVVLAQAPGFVGTILARFRALTPGEPPSQEEPRSWTAVQWRRRARALARRVAALEAAQARTRFPDASLPAAGAARPAVAALEAARVHGDLAVGCVITTFESASTIEAALASVLAQTRPFGRVLVCDDGSSDDTAARAEAMLADAPFASVVRRERNLGVAVNRDLGIRSLGTNLFTQLDGDDRFDPTKNESEVSALRDPRSDIAFSDIELIAGLGRSVLDLSPLDGMDGAAAFAPLARRTIPVPRDMTLSVDLYLAAGGYEAGVPMYEDWSLKLRLCRVMTGAWRRAAGVGTYYDRRSPGLSRGPPIRRVYWRLRALGAAARDEGADEAELAEAVRAALTQIRGALRGLPDRWIDQSPSAPTHSSGMRAALTQLERGVDLATPDAGLSAALYAFLRDTMAR